MPLNLKTTILASTALAGLLNLVQFTSSYNQQAKASFAPSWAEASVGQPTPRPTVPRSVSATTVATTPPAAPAPAPDTTTAPVAAAQAKLSAAGLNPVFAANYLSVQAQTGTPWQLLAAVHRIESGQSGNTARRSYAGATGPMQFMPATFNHYALDGDGNGTKDITDLDDALLTAGRYLAAGGAARGNYQTALYNYNHSNTYVANVLAIAHRLGL
jgi:soluble lytic murein transglycosylase-like protein